MAANKGRKGKAKKSTPSRKSRLWLRDLLNILGGLLVGSLGLWIVQGYLDTRTAREACERYAGVIEGDLPVLKKASEGYEALSESKEGALQFLQGVDITGALYRVDAYRGIHQDFADLGDEARPLLLAFYLSLRDAELLRKMIIEQREHPEQMNQILAREFLRTLHEATQLAPRLLWALGANRKSAGSP